MDEQEHELPRPASRRGKRKASPWHKGNWNRKLDAFPEAGLRQRWDARVAELLSMGLSHGDATKRLIPEFEALLAQARAQRQLLGKVARTSNPVQRQQFEDIRQGLPQGVHDPDADPANIDLIRDFRWVYSHNDPASVPDFSKAPSPGCRGLWKWFQEDVKAFMLQMFRTVPAEQVNPRGGSTKTILELLESLKRIEQPEPPRLRIVGGDESPAG